ncbi:MAG: DUF4097 family beta strand repeat protein [Candidatus Latescibacteria bacterium]|nr:DUF4097 family beta strand repeat protein [Candidatus Latescibacterota bacterium]NIO00971.1 DUF4097 family beta strand repeat protein [Candidatus Latescibacterota bacterium]NIO27370.1 DUF4097 family beta strand repeat protein [Candidatus Latescibacterota bacterium]NIO54892.1 DUF4097 family beta strand repeat protein [Candidatus Latescibacterota bacterium]NIT00981.1 DUF4097 family beta strand repeat protein [Candidatus Latescibacterota bacterium]
MKRRNRLILSVIAAALLLFSIAVASQEKGQIERKGSKYVELIDKTLKAKKGGELLVESDLGSIEVETWTRNEVRVVVEKEYRGSSESKAKTAFDDYEVYIEGNGKDIQVRMEAAGERHERHMGISFEITVPNAYNLDLETKAGSIDISDLEGNVLAETYGGSIKVGEIANGDVDVHTKGGSISIGGVENGDCKARTAGGSISVGDVTGALEVKTSGGSIDLANIGKTVDARTAGGSISIESSGDDLLAKTSGGSIRVGNVSGKADVRTAGGSISVGPAKGDVQVQTAGGSIRIDQCGGTVMAQTSGGSISVEGSGGPVEVKTAGGSITIDDAHGYIEARTKGGSIEAKMMVADKDIDTHCTLESSGGEITIWLPRNLAATFDVELELSRWADEEEYDIISDFPLDIKKGRRSITATGDINGGGSPIRLYTVNGDIHIKKLR